MERAKGIEPSFSAWEADVLPLNYARESRPTLSCWPWFSQTGRSVRSWRRGGSSSIRLDDGCIQPSSVDLHVDQHFRLFRNHSMRVIDVREDLEDLTELVDVPEGDALILHPGEFVLGSTRERVALPDDLVARLEGKSSLGPAGAADPLDGRVRRRRLGRAPHAGALERGQPAHHRVPGDEDRADQLPADDDGGREPLRFQGPRFEVPGPAGPDPEPVLRELPYLISTLS